MEQDINEKGERFSRLWKVIGVPALLGVLITMTHGSTIPSGANIADQRQLFVDTALIERMDEVALKLHEPVSGGTAIKLDKQWEGPGNAGLSVLRLDGRYLMYYRAMTLNPGDESGVLCVAISDDGVNWKKPLLGLVQRAGRSDTNIVADETGNGFMATPWLDARPGVPADERIKAIASQPISGEKHTAFKAPEGPKRLVFWGSADGFAFHKLDPQPEMVSNLNNSFDGGNTMFWSEAEKRYVFYYRFNDGYRTMARATSKDLLHWSESVAMTYGDTPREQLYTNNTEPYFRAPQIYIALAARFMKGRRVITDAQAEIIGLKDSHGHFYGNDCSDAVLLTSRAHSTRYDRTFMEALVRPGPGAQNWVSRTNYPLTGIIPFGNDRMMFWVSRHYMQESWHIERRLLRLDGFISVNAPYAGGELVTKPLIFDGEQLEINTSTSAAGSVRVEIQDAGGKPFSEYTIDNCEQIIGDEVARVVTWRHGFEVGLLAGRQIRLRFVLKDADLYSFRFRRVDEPPRATSNAR
jgi:hypothetical protein